MSATLAAAGISAGVQLIGGLIGGGSARRARRRAERRMRDQQARLDQTLANRGTIINPYAGVTDLSGLISNPFANLQVATEAAEFQAEEADMSLASTLDTLRATGAGAGGATALAQEARSVADISRLSGMMQQYGQQAMDASAAQGNIFGSALGSIGSIAAAGITGQAQIEAANG